MWGYRRRTLLSYVVVLVLGTAVWRYDGLGWTAKNVSSPSFLSQGEEASFLGTLLGTLYDIRVVAGGPEARALWLALGLAVFDQVGAKRL